MSVLIVCLPSRERLGPRAPAGEAAAWRLPAQWAYVYSADDRGVTQTGEAAPALLPRAERVVLRLSESDLSWHRVTVPKAPSGRLRAALMGVMEDLLLDEEDALHLALGPQAVPGRPGWVAVTQRPRLQAALAALEAHGLSVQAVVAAAWPQAESVRVHVQGSPAPAPGLPGLQPSAWATVAGPDGVVCVDLSGGWARGGLPSADSAARWTASPAAVALAERWLGAAVPMLSDAEWALEAAAGSVNLRQFDLAAQARGTRALRGLGRTLLSRPWRPVRLGLLTLLGLNLVGLNVEAWQQRQALVERRLAMDTLLRTTHPGVRTVLDAPLQMQREGERLRTAAGKPGDSDFEVLLAAAAAAWPDGLGPAPVLQFEPGRLRLGAPGWGDAQLQQFQQRLGVAGLQADLAEAQVSVRAAAARGVNP